MSKFDKIYNEARGKESPFAPFTIARIRKGLFTLGLDEYKDPGPTVNDLSMLEAQLLNKSLLLEKYIDDAKIQKKNNPYVYSVEGSIGVALNFKTKYTADQLEEMLGITIFGEW